MGEYIPIKEFAKLLPYKISEQWIRKLIRDGVIQAIRIKGSRARFYINTDEINKIFDTVGGDKNETNKIQ